MVNKKSSNKYQVETPKKQRKQTKTTGIKTRGEQKSKKKKKKKINDIGAKERKIQATIEIEN